MVSYFMYILIKHKNWKICFTSILASSLTTICTFYFYGGFYHLHAEDASPSGLGYYSANLNALFNPLETHGYLGGYSLFFKTLPIATDGQYEGYAYLGAGLLLLAIISIILFFKKSIQDTKLYKWKEYKCEIFSIIFAIFVLYLSALGTDVTLGADKLFTIPYPSIILKIYAIFRSTGRFLWGVWDIISILILYGFWKCKPHHATIVLLLLCIIIQIFDFSFMIGVKFFKYSQIQNQYVTSLQNHRWESIFKDKEEIILFNKQMLNLQTYYDLGEKTLNNHMGINDFYYSRRNAEEIDRYKEQKYHELLSGNASENAVYIVDTFEDVNQLLPHLNFRYIEGLLVGEKEKHSEQGYILSVNPVCADLNLKSGTNVIQNLDTGTYALEIYGTQASFASVLTAKKAVHIYNRYDGDTLGIAMFTLKDPSDLTIKTFAKDNTLNLYKIHHFTIFS